MNKIFRVIGTLCLSLLVMFGSFSFAATPSQYAEQLNNDALVAQIDMTLDRVQELPVSTQQTLIERLQVVYLTKLDSPVVATVINYIVASLQENVSPYANNTIVETAIDTEQFPTLVLALQEAALVETLSSEGPFTVFAPTEEAFSRALEQLDMTAEELLEDTDLLTQILTYHVVAADIRSNDALLLGSALIETVEGEAVNVTTANGVMINNATVVQADIITSNGIIHVIDEVLLPTSLGMTESPDASYTTIVDVAVDSGDFPTLVAALQAAELASALEAQGPFTVFAPTEEAFAQLLQDLDMTAQELLADTDLLTQVLLYHVVDGQYTAEDVLALPAGTEVPTLQGQVISIDTSDAVMVNDSTVVQTDLMADNGVIHVIDTVLVPSM